MGGVCVCPVKPSFLSVGGGGSADEKAGAAIAKAEEEEEASLEGGSISIETWCDCKIRLGTIHV